MSDCTVLNLLKILDSYGEDRVQQYLSRFQCPQNKDVERFIQINAISFARKFLAMTYLVFSYTEKPHLLGYFTLANNGMKSFAVSPGTICAYK